MADIWREKVYKKGLFDPDESFFLSLLSAIKAQQSINYQGPFLFKEKPFIQAVNNRTSHPDEVIATKLRLQVISKILDNGRARLVLCEFIFILLQCTHLNVLTQDCP